MNHAEPYEGTGASCHCEIVAPVEGLSHIFPPPKSEGHDEEGQPGEEPVDKKRGIHGCVGVLPGILLHGPAVDVTSEKGRLLKRTTKIRIDGVRVRLSSLTRRSSTGSGPRQIKTVEQLTIKMDSCKMLRLKSSSCLAGISSVALASSTGLWSVWSAQFTGLARVPFGAGSEQLKKELIPQV